MGASPGWYPDPSGGTEKRYWDGYAWRDAVPVRPGPESAKTGSAWKPLLIICGSAILLGGIVMAFSGGEVKRNAGSSNGGTTYTEEEIRSTVIDVCQKSIRTGLRDADSAKFSEWKAWPAPNAEPPPGMVFYPAAGDKVYSAGGLVNAKNGFGGYAGNEMYACSAVVTTSGNVRAEASTLQ